MTDQQLYLAIGVPLLGNFVSLMVAVFWQTKRFDDLRDLLRAEIATLRAELKGEMATLRTELRSEMTNLRTEFRSEMGILRAELGGKIDNLAFRVKALEDQAQQPLIQR